MTDGFTYHDECALLERLTKGLRRRDQEAIFLVGAPFSAPMSAGAPGVPDVEGTIALIRSEFSDDPSQVSALDRVVETAGDRRYQNAFVFLQGRRGQQTANEIIRRAVRAARIPGSGFVHLPPESYRTADDGCRLLDLDINGWALNPGTANLGSLAARYPNRFGRCILTTNFDPLIEVAIRRAGGNYFRTTLHADGNLSQTEGNGCHVVHLHGYWYGSDTLHTPRQLGQSRPRLRASLGTLLRNKLVVVCAYGGWDDTFTEALMEVVQDDAACPEIVWTFHRERPVVSQFLASRIGPGIDRGRVVLYEGVDCHEFLPKLYDAWAKLEAGVVHPLNAPSNPVSVSEALRKQVLSRADRPAVLEGDDEDRPPIIDICVGREAELGSLLTSTAKVVFLTGLGGQGKSTLAARYFAECQARRTFSFYVWRDCKEEGERFENQLASVIESLSEGRLSGTDLAKQTIESIVEMLFGLIKDVAILFVFDNVDHYVNLETERMVGSLDVFIRALVRSQLHAQAIFTCRPSVSYDDPLSLSCRLAGLPFEAALELFAERSASAPRSQIEDAHRLTDGHAFWLDLLAIQAAKRAPSVDLTSIVHEIRSGGGLLPENTLNSIWSTLKEREKTVLRSMAETIKPETEIALGDYLRGKLNYNKVMKTLRALRSLNLVVVKQRPDGSEVLELHPMVRRFIWQHFPRDERLSFIGEIIKVYKQHISRHRSQLSERPPLSILQYWTQSAELAITAGQFNEAFLLLSEVGTTFSASAYSREFCRVARMLFSTVDWVTRHARFKTFERVFDVHTDLLSYLGEYVEVDGLLDLYEKTVASRDARYIHYCQLRAQSKWVRGEFTAAVKWGETGQGLKESSGVDTQYDVSHTLALAQRDAGLPEAALPTFLQGQPLAEATDPEEFDEQKTGAYYGNIGRCLHFMGQIEPALVCYQKSALLIERDPVNEHFLNQGYIRLWIGELLVAKSQFRLASAFFRAAYQKWEQISPPKAISALRLSDQIDARVPDKDRISSEDSEKVCLDWILGRRVDV